MATAPGARPAETTPRGAPAYTQALAAFRSAASRVLRLSASSGPLLARDRVDGLVYLGAALGLALTLAPFATAGVGLDAVPMASTWDSLGRAQALATSGPLPLVGGAGPSSPLWVWLLALAYAPLGWTGISIVAVAKLLGWLAAIAGAAAYYSLAFRLTGERWPGVLAIALIVADPALALGRASASETPLTIALIAFASLAAIARRDGLLGLVLAGIVLVRPDGVLIAAAFGAALVVEALAADAPARAPDAIPTRLGRSIGPPLAAIALWAVVGIVTAGRPLPPTAVASDGALEVGGSAAGMLWTHVLARHAAFGSGFVLVSLAAVGWVAARFVRLAGPRGAVVGAVPIVIVLSALLAPSPSPEAIARLIEPALAAIETMLAIGLAAAGAIVWRSGTRGLPVFVRGMPGGDRAIVALPLLLWILTAGLGWLQVTRGYGAGAREVATGPHAAVAWLNQNLPANALVALVPAAAPARDRLARPAIALEPLPDWSAARDLARDVGATHLVAPVGVGPALWPMARLVHAIRASASGEPEVRDVGIYRLDWSLPKRDASLPVALRIDGYTVVDSLDIGDDVSETRHFYRAATRGQLVTREGSGPTGWVVDRGRAQDVGRGAESFTLRVLPGHDLVLGVRYDGAVPGTLRFDLDGVLVEWRLRACGAPLCEDATILPSGRIRSDQIRLNIAFAGPPDQPAAPLATFHYWAIANR